jgi:bis(5'-nucleosyl)-tetraphosphatase (symmetrical)
MAVYAIGDVQGCDEELGKLLQRIRFRPDRDRLWFVGDIVNRGPRSLAALRRVHALRDNAVVVLGNHDLHLLAVVHSRTRRLRDGDTLDEVLKAPDRDRLLDWLIRRPLFHYDETLDLAMVHAGLPPQWDLSLARSAAREVRKALRENAVGLFANMYGNKPAKWSDTLTGYDRLRFMVNCFTRLRFCDAKGRINLKLKDAPRDVRAPWLPWFKVPGRASRNARIVCGHWSTLGYYHHYNVLAIDAGCVWGGRLCALRLDKTDDPPVLLRCHAHQKPDAD